MSLGISCLISFLAIAGLLEPIKPPFLTAVHPWELPGRITCPQNESSPPAQERPLLVPPWSLSPAPAAQVSAVGSASWMSLQRNHFPWEWLSPTGCSGTCQVTLLPLLSAAVPHWIGRHCCIPGTLPFVPCRREEHISCWYQCHQSLPPMSHRVLTETALSALHPTAPPRPASSTRPPTQVHRKQSLQGVSPGFFSIDRHF